jgi:integrase
MMAYLGWAPAMIRAFRREDYDATTSTILARGRKKGGGSRAVRQKLIADGARAVETFVAADAFERDLPNGGRTAFSMSSVLRAWRRAIKRLCDSLEKDAATRELSAQLRVQLARATPYSLRHSFLTEVQLATGNISATQSFALHADARMTQRYTLAAVSPELDAAAAALSARLSAERARNVVSNETTRWTSDFRGIAPKMVRAGSTRSGAKSEAKVRKTS